MSQLMYTNRTKFSPRSVGICFVFLSILLSSLVSGGQNTIRVVIDTKALTLKVMEGEQEALSFSNIAIGRYGTDTDRKRGDKRTPLGYFNIAWITGDTPFHRFFGFNYPSKEYAERAFREGRLEQKSWDKIRRAIAAGRLPPQNTILGGNLGIHGIGEGDIKIHEQYNWTNGCIALTNNQVDLLALWIRTGTPVEIR